MTMPGASRSTPLARSARIALAALAAAASACPTGFMDPNPPVLERVQLLWSPPTQDEPAVFAILLDLHLARGNDCAGTKARVASQARSILLPPGAAGMELPLQDISPACRQAPDRRFDTDALDAAIRGAEARYGSRHVRPVLVHFNNIDLAMPSGLQSDFTTMRILANQRAAPFPILWGIAVGRGRDASLYQRQIAWTHSADPSVFTGLAAVASRELPLQGVGQVPAGGVPLFSVQEAATVVKFKACGLPDPRITPQGFAFDGRARAVDPAAPPRFLFSAPDSPPVMRSEITVQPVSIWVETCSANCDHFARREDGSLAVWDRWVGCVLPAEVVP